MSDALREAGGGSPVMNMRWRRSGEVVLLLATAGCPGIAGAGQELAHPSSNVPAEWQTHVETTEFRQTPRYTETMAFCRRLAEVSDWITCGSFGTSPEGRDLPLVIASKGGAFSPEAARKSGKLIVLVQNCIHAGECAGKDASLMLLRDIAVTRTQQSLLDQVVLLVIPIFSTDGHERFSAYSRINQIGPEEMGWRVTSRNLNLNRDYLKADAVEMRAWLALWNKWQPDFFFDNHSTDGGDWQYDLMFATEQHAVAAPQVVAWLQEALYPPLLPALESDGHRPITYFFMQDSKDPAKGIRSGGFSPRYSTGYAAIRNRPAMLVETHARKTYRTRVIGNYNIMRHTLEILNRDPQPLRMAIREADAAAARLGERGSANSRLPIAVAGTDEAEPITFKGFAYRREPSEISGDVRILYDPAQTHDFETVWFRKTQIEREITPPVAYVVPPQWTEVIELAEAHGLQGRRLTESLTAEFESYRFEDVEFPSRPYEGRFSPRFTAVPIRQRRTYRPGSVIFALDQPTAKVAIHLFEPEAPDSLVVWGFFNAIFERKEYGEHYVLEGLAREMLAADPKLRAEFERRVAEDAEFAANPWARLYYFYERSPYWDDRLNVYPIARIAPLNQSPPDSENASGDSD